MYCSFQRGVIFGVFSFLFFMSFRFVFFSPTQFECKMPGVGGGNGKRQWHLRSLLILTSGSLLSQDALCRQQSL